MDTWLKAGTKSSRGFQESPGTLSSVLVFESELEKISSFAAIYPDLETGGSLFGYWTHSGAAVVFLAIGPGERARHEVTSFYQDEQYLLQCTHLLYDSFGLQHIGEWHSHHQLRLYSPSGGDARTVRVGLEARKWDRFVIAITNLHRTVTLKLDVDCRFFHFDRNRPDYQECEVQILPGESPIRSRLPALPAGEPESRSRTTPSWKVREKKPEVAPVREGWYGQSETRKRLVRDLRGLEVLAETGYSHVMEQDGDVLRLRITLPGERKTDWTLQSGYPEHPPLVRLDGKDVELSWKPDRLIAEHLIQEPFATDPRAAAVAKKASPPVEASARQKELG